MNFSLSGCALWLQASSVWVLHGDAAVTSAVPARLLPSLQSFLPDPSADTDLPVESYRCAGGVGVTSERE